MKANQSITGAFKNSDPSIGDVVYFLNCVPDIMKDVLDKVAQGTLKPNVTKTVTLDNVMETLKELPHHRVGKIVLQCTP